MSTPTITSYFGSHKYFTIIYTYIDNHHLGKEFPIKKVHQIHRLRKSEVGKIIDDITKNKKVEILAIVSENSLSEYVPIDYFKNNKR